MLRSVTLGLVLSALAAACALVEPPPLPSGTVMVQSEVRNMSAEPVQLEVRTPAGPLPGAVQPASVPAQTTTNVTFYIPTAEDWTIWVDGEPLIVNTAMSSEMLRQGCQFGMVVATKGGFRYGCDLLTVP